MAIIMKSRQVAGWSIVVNPIRDGVGLTLVPLENHKTSLILSHSMSFAEMKDLMDFLNEVYDEYTRVRR